MKKYPVLIPVGSEVEVDLRRMTDRISVELYKDISKNPIGKVIDYKMTDGMSIGVVIKFANGSEKWFFEEELKQIKRVNISELSNAEQTLPINNENKNYSYLSSNNFNVKEYSKPKINSSNYLRLLNPVTFFQWLIYSLKDVT